MALQVATPKRVFIIKQGSKKTELPDPHPNMTPQEVINHYKPKYPEIAAATVEGPVMEDDKAVYRFNTVIGDKG